MVLTDIEEHIKPLSKTEKEQLIRDVERMLIDDEIEQHRDEILREMIDPRAVYEIATPNITTDDDNIEAVRVLHNFFAEHGHAV